MEILLAGAQKLGITLSSDQIDAFQRYYQELVEWNRRINLTAIVDYQAVQVKHFLDSLTVSLALEGWQRPAQWRCIDVGSGAGLPGIPLKLVYPQMELVLLDATAKRTAFLNHITGCLGLSGVEVITARSEDLAHQLSYREAFHLAVSRGVAPLATLVELMMPFCLVGGRAVALKKGEIKEEMSRAQKALSETGGRLLQVRPVPLFPDQRYLVIGEKVAPTPSRYPRRPGLPVRRPLK